MTNTKTLFSSLVKALGADCICDIGSRDGKQSLLFRHLRPDARVLAFEANPANARHMRENPLLQAERIEIHEIAIADREGTMDFHLSADDTAQNEVTYGTSSLLARTGRAVLDFQEKGVATVRTRRLDDVLNQNCPAASRIALWIDAEGAEYMILQGLEGIAAKVYVLHVETAVRPLFVGQKPLPEVAGYLKQFGFVPCGNNITEKAGWGDVVFVREDWAKTIGFAFTKARWKALLSRWAGADTIAVALKTRWPWLYGALRKLYIKLT